MTRTITCTAEVIGPSEYASLAELPDAVDVELTLHVDDGRAAVDSILSTLHGATAIPRDDGVYVLVPGDPWLALDPDLAADYVDDEAIRAAVDVAVATACSAT